MWRLLYCFGYTAGFQGDYSDLIYLRSRYYSPETGRFQTRDTWQGDYNRPLSFNRWGYGYGNPVKYTDPTGYDAGCVGIDCSDWSLISHTVKILEDKGDGGGLIWLGLGTMVIDNHTIATAGHVVSPTAKAMMIIDNGGHSVTYDLVKPDPDYTFKNCDTVSVAYQSSFALTAPIRIVQIQIIDALGLITSNHPGVFVIANNPGMLKGGDSGGGVYHNRLYVGMNSGIFPPNTLAIQPFYQHFPHN